jgi:hypothetical protein
MSDLDYDLSIPEFLKISKAQRAEAWAKFRPKGATGPAAFDWHSYYGPGASTHRLGYAETDEDRATRVQWIKAQAEHSERSQVKFEEKRLDQDDADIRQATLEHMHKQKRGKRQRRTTLRG